MPAHLRTKASLFLDYVVFAILLNSVGTVILQVIREQQISEAAASVLEAYKDLAIAGFSFVSASFLPRLGYRRAMLIGLALAAAACLAMATHGGFTMARVLFAATGVGFALIKVSTYATVGLIAPTPNEHASVMSTLEGTFQIGVLAGYWLFGLFIGSPGSWLRTYWVLAALSAGAFALLLLTRLDERPARGPRASAARDFLQMLGLVRHPVVLLFAGCAFLYVFIEQGVQSWLPTFNNRILQLPPAMSVQVTSIFAGALALGRISAGAVMRRVSWLFALAACIVACGVLVAVVVPLSRGVLPGSVTGWLDAPLVAYALPLLGFFLAPIYPTLCSSVLSRLPPGRQAAMSGLIVLFSALGGTIGSRVTGTVFSRLGGVRAFLCTLAPLALLLVILVPYRRALATSRVGERE